MRQIASRDLVKKELGKEPGDFWVEMNKEFTHGESHQLRKLFERYTREPGVMEDTAADLIVFSVKTWNVVDHEEKPLPVNKETLDLLKDEDFLAIMGCIANAVREQYTGLTEEAKKV